MSGAEKGVENTLLEYLRIRGIYAQKTHSGSIFVKKGPMTYKMKLCDQGTPDIMACLKGRFLGIEVKKDQEEIDEWERQWEQHQKTKELKTSWERSVFQHMQHDLIRAAGGEVIVCCSMDELDRDINTLLAEWAGSEVPTLKKPPPL